jgi:hypothetical protein
VWTLDRRLTDYMRVQRQRRFLFQPIALQRVMHDISTFLALEEHATGTIPLLNPSEAWRDGGDIVSGFELSVRWLPPSLHQNYTYTFANVAEINVREVSYPLSTPRVCHLAASVRSIDRPPRCLSVCLCLKKHNSSQPQIVSYRSIVTPRATKLEPERSIRSSGRIARACRCSHREGERECERRTVV